MLQYLLLRRYLSRVGGWILATTLGMALGLLLAYATTAVFLVEIDYSSLVPILLLFLLIGAVTGLLQWFVLRRRLPRAGWWVPGSTLGWLLICLLALQPQGRFFTSLAMGLFPGLVTGIAFWMLTRGALPLQPEQSP